MRITAMVLSIFVLALTLVASENPQQTSTSATTPAPDPNTIKLDVYARLDASQFAQLGTFPFPGTCLSMRTFTFARESTGSDSTKLVKYRTCVPSRGFRVYRIETGSAQIGDGQVTEDEK